MSQTRVKIHRRVLPGLAVLTAAETEHLSKTMEVLETFSPEQPLAPTMKLLDPDRLLYSVQIDPGLMAMFSITERDEIEILDLFDPERLVLHDWKKLKES